MLGHRECPPSLYLNFREGSIYQTGKPLFERRQLNFLGAGSFTDRQGRWKVGAEAFPIFFQPPP